MNLLALCCRDAGPSEVAWTRVFRRTAVVPLLRTPVEVLFER
jgi:hypothetical protein